MGGRTRCVGVEHESRALHEGTLRSGGVTAKGELVDGFHGSDERREVARLSVDAPGVGHSVGIVIRERDILGPYFALKSCHCFAFSITVTSGRVEPIREVFH